MGLLSIHSHTLLNQAMCPRALLWLRWGEPSPVPDPKAKSHLSAMDTVGHTFFPEILFSWLSNVTDLVFSHHTDTKKGKSIKGSKILEAEPCVGDRFLKKKYVYTYNNLENE